MRLVNDSDEFLERLRKLIKEVRIDSGKTQVEFANSVEGLQQSSIARLETGRSENIGIKILYEVALACRMPLSEIIRRAEGITTKQDDSWDRIEKQVQLLSSPKRKWLAKVVKEIISEPSDR